MTARWNPRHWNWTPGRRRILRAALAVTLIALAVSIALHLRDRQRVRRALEERLQQAWVLESHLPPLEKGEPNGSHVLNAIGYLLRLRRSADAPSFPWRQLELVATEAGQGEHPAAAEARRWLDLPHHRLALEMLDLHAGVKRARLAERQFHHLMQPLDYEGYGVVRTEIVSLVGLLKTRAWLALQRGDTDAAFRDVRLMLRVASWLQSEHPGILSWLLRNATASNGLEGFEQLQRGTRPTPEQRQALRDALETLGAFGNAWGLQGEWAFSPLLASRAAWTVRGLPADHPAYRHLAVTRGLSPPPFGSYSLETSTEIRRSGEVYRRLIARAESPPHTRPPIASLAQGIPGVGAGDVLPIPNLVEAIRKTDLVDTWIRLGTVALAWYDFEQLQGTAPGSLDELTPDFLAEPAVDPWSGGPFILERRETGCRLYSVGPDGRDDGGAGEPPGGEAERDDIADDITWHLPCGSTDWHR